MEIKKGYSNCDPERWLKVIPQLIALMDMKHVDAQVWINTFFIFACNLDAK